MMMKFLFVAASALLLMPAQMISQPATPPVPVEIFSGTDYVDFQMIVNKKFNARSKFGFFNVTVFRGDYNNEQSQNEYLSQAFLTYDIVDGIALSAGGWMHFLYGFRPTAGFQYSYGNRELLFVIFPRFDLTEDYNFEAFSLVEYQPGLNDDWRLYSRLQGLYNHNTVLNFHDRSYINLRLGASYSKYIFGLGANIDYYGPDKTNENRLGVFVRVNLL